jgi:hypothetical protein
VTNDQEVRFCVDPLGDSRNANIEHRRFFTTERLFWELLISSCLLIVNFLGLGALLGTGPSDTLAPLFVIGVGAFWSQVQLLGLFAAFLPCALHRRMLMPVGLILALCAEIFYFYRRVATEGIPYVLLVGFFFNLIIFSLIRAFFGLEMHDQNHGSKTSPRSHARFGIRDLFILTMVVAMCLIMQRIEFNYRMSMGMESQAVHLVFTIAAPLLYLTTMILFALPHFILGIHRSPKRIAVSLVWVAFAVLGVPLLVIGVVVATRTVVNFQNWPYLFCLTLGAELAWLVGIGCMKLLGLRFQIASPRRRDMDVKETNEEHLASGDQVENYC